MADPAAQTIRLLIIDDHALFRDGISTLLSRESDFQVVGRFASPSEAWEAIGRERPKVILLDFDLGAESAEQFARDCKLKGVQAAILVVTAGVSEQEAVRLVQAGVAGIFHKHHPPEMLCQAIRQVAAGEVCLEQNYLKPLFRSMDRTAPSGEVALTERDKAILRYVFQGLANKEIGGRLDLSEGAVKACLRQLFQKLGVHSRAQLVKVALEQYRDQL